MKKNSKTKNKKKITKIAFVIVVIAIILLIVLVVNIIQNNDVEKKYQKILEETSQQSSKKINKSITLGDLEISNIEVLVENGETQIRATVYNNTNKDLGDINTKIIIEDEQNSMTQIAGYIPNISPNQSKNIVSSINKLILNVNDVDIKNNE